MLTFTSEENILV